MKLLLMAMVFCSSLMASAQDGGTVLHESVKFSYSSIRSYYHCNYFETQAKKMVEALGGERVDVRCSGGLPHSSYLIGQIESQALVTGDGRNVAEKEIRIRESCDFNEKLLKAILKSSTRILSVKRSGSCFDSAGRLTYKIRVRQ